MQSLCEAKGKEWLSYIAGGNVNGYNPREGNLVISIKITNAYALWPTAIPLLRMYPRVILGHIPKMIFMSIYCSIVSNSKRLEATQIFHQ